MKFEFKVCEYLPETIMVQASDVNKAEELAIEYLKNKRSNKHKFELKQVNFYNDDNKTKFINCCEKKTYTLKKNNEYTFNDYNLGLITFLGEDKYENMSVKSIENKGAFDKCKQFVNNKTYYEEDKFYDCIIKYLVNRYYGSDYEYKILGNINDGWNPLTQYVESVMLLCKADRFNYFKNNIISIVDTKTEKFVGKTYEELANDNKFEEYLTNDFILLMSYWNNFFPTGNGFVVSFGNELKSILVGVEND